MRDLPIYFKLITAAISAKMQYKVTFLFMLFAIIFFYMGQLGVILVMISQFKSINGWNIGEMAFLYGMLVFSQGITALFFAPLNSFEGFIIQGEFDRNLVRPLNPLMQILSSSFELSSLAHFIIGISALYYGSVKAGVVWTFPKALFFVLAIAGAVLIMGGIRLAVASVCFWTMRNRSLVHTIVFSTKEFIMYPISIYKLWMQVFLTIVLPLGFINFYPSHYFLAKGTADILFDPMLQYLSPVAGVIVFGLAYALWNLGVSRYQSAGN